MKAPTRDPSDFCIAYRAEPALFIPEKAKSTSTPKRVLHMVCFAFLEVGLKGRVVGFASPLTLTCRLMGVLLAWRSQT